MSPSFSHNIELLLKHAAVDPKFRELMLEDPSAVVFYLNLKLTPVEWSMLNNMPKDQLAAIIDQIEVPEDDPIHAERKFGDPSDDGDTFVSFGNRPDMPEEDELAKYRLISRGGGVRPDMPKE